MQRQHSAIGTSRQHSPEWRAPLKLGHPAHPREGRNVPASAAITKVLGAWPSLPSLDHVWFAAALAAEITSFTRPRCQPDGTRGALAEGLAPHHRPARLRLRLPAAGIARGQQLAAIVAGAAGSCRRGNPRPSSAYPAGLGIVEAGLTSLLIVAGYRQIPSWPPSPTGSPRTGCRSSRVYGLTSLAPPVPKCRPADGRIRAPRLGRRKLGPIR